MTDYVTLIAQTAKSFCEDTGMSSSVFHATVRGNIEQAYQEHIDEMVALEIARGNEERAAAYGRLQYGRLFSEPVFGDNLETMCYHEYTKELAKSMPEIS